MSTNACRSLDRKFFELGRRASVALGLRLGYASAMDFIDVRGASGTAYRFRRAELSQLPATARNLVGVPGLPTRRRYVACGAAHSLSQAAPAVKAVLAD